MKWDLSIITDTPYGIGFITAALEEAADTADRLKEWASEIRFFDFRPTRAAMRLLAKSLDARAAVLRRQLDKLTSEDNEDEDGEDAHGQ